MKRYPRSANGCSTLWERPSIWSTVSVVLAKATEEGKYATAATKRVQRVADTLQAIDALIPIPEVKEILGVIKGVDLKIGNEAALAAAAGTIAAATRTVRRHP